MASIKVRKKTKKNRAKVKGKKYRIRTHGSNCHVVIKR